MRKIKAKKITETVKKLCIDAAYNLPSDVEKALNKALRAETAKRGKEIIKQILQNAKIARTEKLPLCQDTGVAVVFVEIGQEVQIEGSLEKAINQGVAQGYRQGYLRKSMVKDPLNRKNTGDNTPAIIHTEIVPGKKLKITFLAKGCGAENCSAVKMLLPTASVKEIEDFVVETIKAAGANTCPPAIVGVGIGGNLEKAALLAKRALLKKADSSKRKAEHGMERKLLKKINALGIGPMGLGGKTTALTVNVETYPCHIGAMPVAVNIECHAHRIKSAII